ncbi:MAG: chloride channel protein [Dichotomicrobium sp.]
MTTSDDQRGGPEPVLGAGEGPAADGSSGYWRVTSLIAAARARFVLFVSERFKTNVSDFLADRQPLVWLVALVIGIAAAYAAILFRLAIRAFQLPWLGTTDKATTAAAMQLPWWAVLTAPAIGGLIVGFILVNFQRGRRPHNVADVIEASAVGRCRISARDGFLSALISALSLGTGASAGREGPVVHLGAAIASQLEQRFDLSPGAQRTLLSCGVSAAVAASFNAPIAGVLFAHEVILRHYALRAFVPITISSVVATLIARVHLGNFPAFIVPNYEIVSMWEFPAFALLGIVAAGVAITFQFAIIGADRFSTAAPIPLWLKPAIGGLCVGAIALSFPHVLGVGYDTTDAALNNQMGLWLMLALLVAKTAATAITLGFRMGGGVFSPSLYLGAMTGGAFGLIAASVFPSLASGEGLYAILGMGAVAAAVLGAPISTTLIVFELTAGYQMTIALLLTVSISNGLTQAVHGVSYFHWLLNNRGLFLHEGPHQRIVRSVRVRDLMTPLSEDEDAREAVPEGAPRLQPNHTLRYTLRMFDESGRERLPVMDEQGNELVGWVRHFHAIEAYNKALVAAHVEEHR